MASRLAEAGHYASAQIKQISGQLDQDWKSFAAALDERSTILAMSSVFHQKAKQVPEEGISFLFSPIIYMNSKALNTDPCLMLRFPQVPVGGGGLV